MSKLLKLNIDWAEAFGWYCSHCGGEIDHLTDEDNEDGTVNASYTCRTPRDEQGYLCAKSYFVVRYSKTERGDNGDALTLERFIEIDIEDRYINKPVNPKGLYGKYSIVNADTDEPIEGFAFVLRIKDPHARVAMRAYAASVADKNAELAQDLEQAVFDYERAKEKSG